MTNTSDPFEKIRERENKVYRILGGRNQLEKLSQDEKDQLKNALWDLEEVMPEYISYNEGKIENAKKDLNIISEILGKLNTDKEYEEEFIQGVIQRDRERTGQEEEITESIKSMLIEVQKHAYESRIEGLETDIEGYTHNITMAREGITMENSVNLYLKMY